MPILGLILRSTNVRNAFEVYAPLLRLARQTLDPSTKLLVSSEWDYSPYVYMPDADLPGFVLIGLPATESSNPLLVPLAGHELGHHVWQRQQYATQFDAVIETEVLNELTTARWSVYHLLYPQYNKPDLKTKIFARPTWMPAFIWAILQTEEIFCDLFAVRIFGESYLHAFAYLMSPRTSGQRSVNYPNLSRRVQHLVTAANKMSVTVPSDFEACFEDEDEPPETSTQLLLSVADTVSAMRVHDLIELVIKFTTEKAIPVRDLVRVSAICKRFETVVPAADAVSLTDIVNAGWNCQLNPELWANITHIKPADRGRILRDLVLKSMEVLEVSERLKNNDPQI